MRMAYVSFLALILVTACETKEVNVTCNNVDQKIAMLEKEKGYNQMREKDKVYTVYPPTVIQPLVMGDDAPPVKKMTTKEWGAKLDRAIEDLQSFNDNCGLMERNNPSRRGYRTVIKTRSGSLN